MTEKILISDFTFYPSGYGIYEVTYTSPTTGKKWTTVITDMLLIDDTKNADYPKQRDLKILKLRCKGLY